MQVDLDNAYRFCKEIAVNHYENFPVGSLLIPSDKRKYIYSIYAFARHADDIADSDKYTEAEKFSLLNGFDTELDKIRNNDLKSLLPDNKNIFYALSNTIDELKIPEIEFRDLLIAFKQDAVRQRYETFDELIEYSSYSANPIGHLVLYTFGYSPEKDRKIFEYSDTICTALQLANFWQDVSVDLKIRRVYVPSKVMKDFEYDESMLYDKIENDNFRGAIEYLVKETKKYFIEGNEIIDLVKGRLKLELKATIAGGMKILDKIEKINYNVLSERVSINNIDKLKILGKIFW
ncbi:MAG: squalene synthase HpnC [Ignavibacteria bacterium]